MEACVSVWTGLIERTALQRLSSFSIKDGEGGMRRAKEEAPIARGLCVLAIALATALPALPASAWSGQLRLIQRRRLLPCRQGRSGRRGAPRRAGLRARSGLHGAAGGHQTP